ncbi:MAG: metal-dependent hydrolase [Halodesulfurarchaeum sp.]
MMSSTHSAMGLAGVCVLALVRPEYADVAAGAAIAGGIFPDLDVVFEHRKTLHHPEVYPVLAVLAIGLAVARPRTATIGIATFLSAASLHSLTDVLGGGLGLRPWENDDERGIYLHLSGRWLPPRRWVRYDGAPEDLLVAVAFSIPPFLLFDGVIRTAILVGLAGSAVYVLVRKRLADIHDIVF